MSGQLFPYAAAEVTAPIVGQLFSLMPRQDMEELTVRSIRILTSLFEPFMFIRAMVHHQIHHDGYAAFLAFGNQAIHILGRVLNNNFSAGDLLLTLTYDEEAYDKMRKAIENGMLVTEAFAKFGTAPTAPRALPQAVSSSPHRALLWAPVAI